MRGLLIASKNQNACDKLGELFMEDGYQITRTNSVANALEGIINKEIQVVILDGLYDEQNMVKLIPLMKKCNRNISIILVTDDIPLGLIRKIRQEGVFYHALSPSSEDHYAEIREATCCAFKKYDEITTTDYNSAKEMSMSPLKAILSSLTLVLVLVSPVFAVDTTVTYSSGLLILLFVGFCALLIVAQLIPALLALFGMTTTAGSRVGEAQRVTSGAKNR